MMKMLHLAYRRYEFAMDFFTNLQLWGVMKMWESDKNNLLFLHIDIIFVDWQCPKGPSSGWIVKNKSPLLKSPTGNILL